MIFVETKENSNRFVNLEEVTQCLLHKTNDRVAFNFRSTVSRGNSDYIIPAFHYVDFDSMEEAHEKFKEYFQLAQNKNLPVFLFETNKYLRFINFNNVNSFLFNEIGEQRTMIVNFSSENHVEGGALIEHNVKINHVSDGLLHLFKRFLKGSRLEFKRLQENI